MKKLRKRVGIFAWLAPRLEFRQTSHYIFQFSDPRWPSVPWCNFDDKKFCKSLPDVQAVTDLLQKLLVVDGIFLVVSPVTGHRFPDGWKYFDRLNGARSFRQLAVPWTLFQEPNLPHIHEPLGSSCIAILPFHLIRQYSTHHIAQVITLPSWRK